MSSGDRNLFCASGECDPLILQWSLLVSEQEVHMVAVLLNTGACGPVNKSSNHVAAGVEPSHTQSSLALLMIDAHGRITSESYTLNNIMIWPGLRSILQPTYICQGFCPFHS